MTQITQTQAPQAQVVQKKRNYTIPAVIVAGTGAIGGYTAHRTGVKEIAKAAAECDETLIRNRLKKFWKWENGVPESSKKFFEDAVEGHMNFAKKVLANKKSFFKGAGLAAGLGTAAVSALLIGLSSVIFGGKNKA